MCNVVIPRESGVSSTSRPSVKPHALTKDGGDDAAFNVFTKRGGKIRHFWGGEMNAASADPGQDPRGAPDLMPLWTILDVTPEGRGTDWYPKLNY